MTHLTTDRFITFIFTAIFSMVSLAVIPTHDKTDAAISNENISQSPAAVVEMTNTMKFTPDTVHITKGETVKWKNTSLLAHSVTGDPAKSTVEGSAQLPQGGQPFNSGMLDPKQSFQHTFKTTGTYQYFCTPHEGAKMFGWVIVSKK